MNPVRRLLAKSGTGQPLRRASLAQGRLNTGGCPYMVIADSDALALP